MCFGKGQGELSMFCSDGQSDALGSLYEMDDIYKAEADEEQDAHGAGEGGEDPVSGGRRRRARLLLEDGAAGLRLLVGALFILGSRRRLGVGIDERTDNRVLPEIRDIVDFCDSRRYSQALHHVECGVLKLNTYKSSYCLG